MTNKRYNELRDYYECYNGYDMLQREEMKELRKDIKERLYDGEIKLCDRATYRYTDNGVILTSYYTAVCAIDTHNNFVKLWAGYSKTTLKHINMFRAMWSLPPMNKRQWIEYQEC